MDVAAMTEQQRAVWRSGDYGEIAPTIEDGSLALVERMGIEGGQRVLDVACGTGNSAIPAAGLGAEVVGLDLTPELFERARERAAEAGVEVEWVEGDAAQLPFEEDSFDRVLSAYGVMFAPDHRRAAAELVRVCRPGGRIGVCAWTPEGLIGRVFAAMGSRMPPPPEGFVPPVMWGNEDHVRELFADAPGELRFERLEVVTEADSVEEFLEFHKRALPPLLAAKPALEASGQWEEALEELLGLYHEGNEATDGSMLTRSEYLLTVLSMHG